MAQQLVNGLTIGVIYALIAMGFSMVWATARTLNFAYGGFYLAGAYTLYFALEGLFGSTQLSVAAVIAVFALTAVVGVAMGYAMERAVFRPLRESEMAPYLASFGVAIIIDNLVVLIFGGRSKALDASPSFVDVGSVRFTSAQVGVLIASVLIMIALQFVIAKTSTGRAMRATAWSRTTARLMGVNPNRIIAMVFMAAGVLAMWAGMFTGLFYGSIGPKMDHDVVIKGLAAAVVGGFGYLPGAIAGGLLIGAVEAVGAQYTTSGEWPDVIAYSALILMILVRPQGLFRHAGAVG